MTEAERETTVLRCGARMNSGTGECELPKGHGEKFPHQTVEIPAAEPVAWLCHRRGDPTQARRNHTTRQAMTTCETAFPRAQEHHALYAHPPADAGLVEAATEAMEFIEEYLPVHNVAPDGESCRVGCSSCRLHTKLKAALAAAKGGGR